MIFLFLTDCLRPTAQPPPEVSTSLVSLHLQLASTSPLLSFFFFFCAFSFFSPIFSFHSALVYSLSSSFICWAYSSAALLDTALPGFLFRVSSSPGSSSRRIPLFLLSSFSFFSFPSLFHTLSLFFCCLIRVGAFVVVAAVASTYSL